VNSLFQVALLTSTFLALEGGADEVEHHAVIQLLVSRASFFVVGTLPWVRGYASWRRRGGIASGKTCSILTAPTGGWMAAPSSRDLALRSRVLSRRGVGGGPNKKWFQFLQCDDDLNPVGHPWRNEDALGQRKVRKQRAVLKRCLVACCRETREKRRGRYREGE